MNMSISFRRLVTTILLGAFWSVATVANAEDGDKDHMAAARGAIAALGATDQFDSILPNAAEELKRRLIQRSPNLQETITVTVDEAAINLVGRRGDLEREAAAIYVKSFTKAELDEIAKFYNSDLGKKFIEKAPDVTRDLLGSAKVWSTGISRDLTTEVQKSLRDSLGKTEETPKTEETKKEE